MEEDGPVKRFILEEAVGRTLAAGIGRSAQIALAAIERLIATSGDYELSTERVILARLRSIASTETAPTENLCSIEAECLAGIREGSVEADSSEYERTRSDASRAMALVARALLDGNPRLCAHVLAINFEAIDRRVLSGWPDGVVTAEMEQAVVGDQEYQREMLLQEESWANRDV